MPIYIDPNTRQRILYQAGTSDIEYLKSQSSEAVTHETLQEIGGWADYSGSGGKPAREQQIFGGVENEFFGTDPGFTENKDNLGNVGQRLSTTRRRQIKAHVDLK